MTKKPFLSVIIPVYNEIKTLPLTLIDIDRHLFKVKYSYEILVVNDGSIDGTAEVVKRLSSIIKNLRLIDNEKNRGKGAVIRQGMLEAEGDYRLFTDADNSVTIDQFQEMIPYFSAKGGSVSGGKKGYEIVIGSRDVKGANFNSPKPWYKKILMNFDDLFIKTLLLPGIRDTQCEFKCFSRKAALKIFSLQRINGLGFNAEILSLAKTLGYEVKELPVIWMNDFHSRVILLPYLKTFMEIIKVRLWLWSDVYKIKIPKEKVAN